MQTVQVEELPTVVGTDRSLRGLIRMLDLFALISVALAHNTSNLGVAFRDHSWINYSKRTKGAKQ